MKYTYKVIAFRQQSKSPIQVAFVAHAAEVLQWSGIPRKSDELLTGYQRFLDDARVDTQITPFFQTPENCSPTAVIVALRKDTLLGQCRLANENVKPGKIVNTELTISFDEVAAEGPALFESALRYVSDRLAASTSPGGSHTEDDSDSNDDVEESLEELDEEENEEDDAPVVHLGTSTLEKMKELLDNRNNWKNKNFRKAMTEYVKPALLIDGQHRTAGAARIGDKGLPFVLCGLYDVPWTEQVFQFTVVNLKPRRLPPSTITAIAGLSLTRAEQDSVEARLQQSGVRMAEVAMMSLVAYDDVSPLAGMVDMNVGSREENARRLGYTSAKRIATTWYRATRKSFTLIAKEIFRTNNQTTARSNWRETRLWFEFFCAFWNTVRRRYPPELWGKSDGNHLFVGSNLWALQESILSQVDAQRRATWAIGTQADDGDDPERRGEALKRKFLEPVDEALDCIPEDIWTCNWKKSSQILQPVVANWSRCSHG